MANSILKTVKTFDECPIYFYEDGMVTDSSGYGFGKGTGRASSVRGGRIALKANLLAAGELCLFDFSEVAAVVCTARAYVDRCDREGAQILPGKFRELVVAVIESHQKHLEQCGYANAAACA
jgi:hypothetical protein